LRFETTKPIHISKKGRPIKPPFCASRENRSQPIPQSIISVTRDGAAR
jgi:hypothetical protein